MSVLSTHNDELLVLIYEHSDTTILSSPILIKSFNLNRNIKSKEFYITNYESVKNRNLILFLVELDSETPLEQINSVIRLNSSKLINEFNNRNYTEISKYLGDEDLLYVKEFLDFKIKREIKHRIKGIYKMDKYEFLIKLTK